MEKKITQTVKGLHTDNSHLHSPKDTYRFALNAVNETEEGDVGYLANEESNEIVGSISTNFIPIGQIYIGNEEIAIFSVSTVGDVSEIGIMSNKGVYKVCVNDSDSDANKKLGFRVDKQIDATFRLRRGCERTIYFVDDYNKPRYINLDRLEDFQDCAGEVCKWNKNKFELIRSYRGIPKFSKIEVLNGGGALEPGSYNVGVQYLDANLNATEWITTSEVMYVYNDDTSEPYLNIEGSVNVVDGGGTPISFVDFPTTDKSISVTLSDLDDTFIFYRLAFIEASKGTGQITRVRVTDKIPTEKPTFIYTGDNFIEEGTEEEILAPGNSVIASAGSIEQVENKLILGKTKGSLVDFCSLQKYASKIKADVSLKKTILNAMVEGNPKSPTSRFEGVGYMPGEIYSFGIVYVFSDGQQSPVYHIPGKNASTENSIFAPVSGEDNIRPMAVNNTNSESSTYIDNSNCSSKDYWGVDSEGVSLKNTPIRHHRFPLRSDLGIPLREVETGQGGEDSSLFYQVKVNINGTMVAGNPRIVAKINYTIDGVADTMEISLSEQNYGTDVTIEELSNIYTSDVFVVTSITEEVDGVGDESLTLTVNPDTVTAGPSTSAVNQLNYTVSLEASEQEFETRLFSSKTLGIKFSGIEIPEVEGAAGETIVGYYIVRNERGEGDKTVLDSGVLFPTVTNSKYISSGLLSPELADDTRISKKVFSLLHPEHKFNNRKYSEFTEFKQEGVFTVDKTIHSKSRIRDCVDGGSFNAEIHKVSDDRVHSGDDGVSVKLISRDNILGYKAGTGDWNIQQDDVEDTFYLGALHSRDIENNTKSVYNIAGDNQIGIVQLKEDSTTPIFNTFPYGHINRPLADNYATFRASPYYKASINIEYFTEGQESEATVFNGDAHVVPMRYANTMFWANVPAIRALKTNAWNWVAAVLLVVVAVVIAIFTWGTGSFASAVLISGAAGLVAVGALTAGAVLYISAGIEEEAFKKAYYEEYARGLRDTVLDSFTDREYKYAGYGNVDGPTDDEIQWIADCATDFWFETQVHASLRHGMTSGLPTFMNAPGNIESGNSLYERPKEHFDTYSLGWDDPIYPTSVLDRHIMDKLTQFNPDRVDSREYTGHPYGEFYYTNEDYDRRNTQKTFFHLPLEYDCCSPCQEEFPHRVHYSEQSFQEELTDNFKVFLPNNYRDIEGETGEITDLFRIKNNLYIHTEEALWHLPQNFQERVTGDIVSFIGTGEYFNLPPRKILDGNKNSGGTKDRWGTLHTSQGVFFVSSGDKKVYLFNGNELQPISSKGMSNWFKDNLDSTLNRDYFNATGREYPFINNPSNPYGSGFISTYDTKKERFILTKKDGLIKDTVVAGEDFEFCVNGETITLFDNYEQIISDKAALDPPERFVGIRDCAMQFERITTENVDEVRGVYKNITDSTDVWFMLDYSVSYASADRDNISLIIDNWETAFRLTNPTWTGVVRKYLSIDNSKSEDWARSLKIIADHSDYTGVDLSTKDVVVISFSNESERYHESTVQPDITAPTTDWNEDYEEFKTTYNLFRSFRGLVYPLVYNDVEEPFAGIADKNKAFIQHAYAAIRGGVYSRAELDSIDKNYAIPDLEWEQIKNSLVRSNPYNTDGLKNYHWQINSSLFETNTLSSITLPWISSDIDEFLEADKVLVLETVSITKEVITPVTVAGTVVNDFSEGDDSWTMSYSLKNNSWVSWHSYIPDFYMYLTDKFFSWKRTFSSIWRHNKKGDYQNFYGERKPFIVEYVSMSDSIQTKIQETIELHTEAKKYDSTKNQYVEDRLTTFNKGVFYNSRQCTGELTLQVKDKGDAQNYMMDQVVSLPAGTVMIDKNEKNWTVNDIRDIRVDYTQPIFDESLSAKQPNYYIDKILNVSSLDENKDWSELETFRDKYLVVRLIFDNFDDVKLVMNYTSESEKQSHR